MWSCQRCAVAPAARGEGATGCECQGTTGDCPEAADHTISQMREPGDKESVTPLWLGTAQACGDQGPLGHRVSPLGGPAHSPGDVGAMGVSLLDLVLKGRMALGMKRSTLVTRAVLRAPAGGVAQPVAGDKVPEMQVAHRHPH